MALDGTYAGLRASIAAFLNRDDLTALIPDFIVLAEARLNDRLRLFPMETEAELVGGFIRLASRVITDELTGSVLTDEDTGGAVIEEGISVSVQTLPSDFLEMRMVIANTNPKVSLKRASPGWTIERYDGLTGYPNVYTIVGGNLVVYPATTATVTLTYYASIPALSDDNPSNWLLSARPQLYLYASLLESAPALMDDARVNLWKAALDEGIANADMSDFGTRWANGVARISGPTP